MTSLLFSSNILILYLARAPLLASVKLFNEVYKAYKINHISYKKFLFQAFRGI